MTEKKLSGAPAWVDPDDAPELTEAFFDQAEIRQGEKVVRKGRPRSTNPKKLVSVRLDQDVLDGWRDTGPGWQGRINDALRDALRRAG
ncbi:BrnA antitoxin family protein [Gluconacetobacter sp. 1b LMG 1731]|uniref:BrnA antitoxin family protein n=1 Tax=Gluconacetobacter dulcium TaxID=2729096 RepID=A0A7W4IMI2_9PROT|nr:BrnA antitoxin family protein [Gluconacetobacter dulcium]MBB2165578.1 BrnA antitoxin family protein [Gluconacetobacter dulcium]MBB2194714.1 BrnA antitoxin family protein [Gluconacetobacter dulcium]MBB2196008.1 BrnA antitoxin family protein [Gluconacetobacter dulcium]